MKTLLLQLALIGFLLTSSWSASYCQKARLKRATSAIDTVVVVSGAATHNLIMELDDSGTDGAATSGFYELYVLVSSYTANGTTGLITVKARDYVKSSAGVKTYHTSINDSVTITSSLTLSANGLYNFHFEAPEAPFLDFNFISVGADDFSFQAWLRYLGE